MKGIVVAVVLWVLVLVTGWLVVERMQERGSSDVGEKEVTSFTLPPGSTDEQLAEALKGLANLEDLDLNATRVTGAGLVGLSGLTNLKRLDLSRTEVTDAGLVHLKGLKNLRRLNLNLTPVTDAAAQRLQEALPDCRIEY